MRSYGFEKYYRSEPHEIDNDYSNARRGRHYVRGHYRYDDGKRHMMGQFKKMKVQVSGKEREIFQLCMDMLSKTQLMK